MLCSGTNSSAGQSSRGSLSAEKDGETLLKCGSKICGSAYTVREDLKRPGTREEPCCCLIMSVIGLQTAFFDL